MNKNEEENYVRKVIKKAKPDTPKAEAVNEYGSAIPQVITDLKEYEETKKAQKAAENSAEISTAGIKDVDGFSAQKNAIFKYVFANELQAFKQKNGYPLTGSAKHKLKKKIVYQVQKGKIYINDIGQLKFKKSNLTQTKK